MSYFNSYHIVSDIPTNIFAHFVYIRLSCRPRCDHSMETTSIRAYSGHWTAKTYIHDNYKGNYYRHDYVELQYSIQLYST